jgi:hypothetical protein
MMADAGLPESIMKALEILATKVFAAYQNRAARKRLLAGPTQIVRGWPMLNGVEDQALDGEIETWLARPETTRSRLALAINADEATLKSLRADVMATIIRDDGSGGAELDGRLDRLAAAFLNSIISEAGQEDSPLFEHLVVAVLFQLVRGQAEGRRADQAAHAEQARLLQMIVAKLDEARPATSGTPGGSRPTIRRDAEEWYPWRLLDEDLKNTDLATPLAAESHVRPAHATRPPRHVVMRPEFAHLGRESEQPREIWPFDDAADEILKRRRGVVLGEPGAGKTTTLLRVARQLVEAAHLVALAHEVTGRFEGRRCSAGGVQHAVSSQESPA